MDIKNVAFISTHDIVNGHGRIFTIINHSGKITCL